MYDAASINVSFDGALCGIRIFVWETRRGILGQRTVSQVLFYTKGFESVFAENRNRAVRHLQRDYFALI